MKSNIKIYNTLSGAKEPLPIPPKGKPLRLFVCGQTVYDYTHIGNARTFASFDMFVKYLRFKGIKVFYLQNITDIDDKIIKRAAEASTTTEKIASMYEKAFHEDEKALRINSVTTYARATKYIKEITKQIQILIKKGHAYKIEGDGWYFDLKTFSNYGKLAKRTTEQAEDGVTRIDQSANKRNAGDFCLWKLADAKTKNANDAKRTEKNDEPFWDSPLGAGRPGWHIEDTAIAEHFFGAQYDIHGGAVDLIFPHHEAEIAQQESASGLKPMVKIWMHGGFFNVKGEKMSKSAGNFLTVRDFLKINSANLFRFIVASHHYRARVEYDDALALQASQSLNTFGEFLEKLALVLKTKNKAPKKISDRLAHYENAFDAAMADDLNTPKALATLFELMNELNKTIWELNAIDAKELQKFITARLTIFGISLTTQKIPSKISAMAKKRELFRIHKQFAQSDGLRKELDALGYKVEDTALGPLVLKKS